MTPAMVDALKSKLVSLGLTARVSVSVQDVRALPSAWAGRFDGVFANLVIMFVPDLGKALQEVYRCVKPGGIAVLTTWSTRRDNPAFSLMYEALEEAIQLSFKRLDASDPSVRERIKAHVPVPMREHPNFSLTNPKILKEELKYAGFSNVRCARMRCFNCNLDPCAIRCCHFVAVLQLTIPALFRISALTHARKRVRKPPLPLQHAVLAL